MKTLVILAHPDIENSKANKKWKEELEKYPNEIIVHELYKEYPDGKIDVLKEQKLIEENGNLILQFPLYWFNCPPLLKIWFDEVWQFGWAYGPNGEKLKGKKIGLAVTTGGIKERYVEGGTDEYSIKDILVPFKASINHVGGVNLSSYLLHGVMPGVITDEEIIESSKKYLEYIKINN